MKRWDSLTLISSVILCKTWTNKWVALNCLISVLMKMMTIVLGRMMLKSAKYSPRKSLFDSVHQYIYLWMVWVTKLFKLQLQNRWRLTKNDEVDVVLRAFDQNDETTKAYHAFKEHNLSTNIVVVKAFQSLLSSIKKI